MLVNRRCECCKTPITVRSADVKRGWGRFCSKSCKAKKQEARTGQYASLLQAGMVPGYRSSMSEFDRHDRDHMQAMDDMETGWDAHKDIF